MHSYIRAVLLHRLLKIVWPLLVTYINSDTDNSNDISYLIIFLKKTFYWENRKIKIFFLKKNKKRIFLEGYIQNYFPEKNLVILTV